MAKRVYKLQEFVAHSAGVNCLNIGKKSCRLLLTGGEDHKVNLWSVGKPTSLMSLCGHTSPVESVAFDSAEVLVLAGASTGAIKMWDLEETKMVRTLNGHRSYCTAVEFHPFGELFASGSMDTNLRFWDIRKKGCVHTYRGHTGGINTIKFTPDGRWLVSGGLDNVAKVWDLTAGRLLHDFKSHEGHIRSVDFHPLDFLLATGSADRTIKFWDLESFELVGSSRAEGSGCRCIKFHPDGSILFCGRDDGLKAYSWEPVLCHDTFDMDWSALGDICINDGKLLACSYHGSSVGIWVADISLVGPYVDNFNMEKSDPVIFSSKEIRIPEKEEDSLKSERFFYGSPEHESKEIKTIYVDSGGKPALPRTRSSNSSKIENVESKDINCLQNQEEVVKMVNHGTCNPQGNSGSFALPSVASENSVEWKHLSNNGREYPLPASFGRKIPITSRKLSSGKIDFDNVSSEEKKLSCDSSDACYTAGSKFVGKYLKVDTSKDSADVDQTNVGSINDKFRSLSLENPSPWTSHRLSQCEQQKSSVTHVNGVFPGRTRSLVEKFERKKRLGNDENDAIHRHLPTISESITTSSDLIGQPQTSGRELTSSDSNCSNMLMQDHESFLVILHSRLTKLQVIRNFWEQNDVKAAIGALLNLSDHSVQVDVITVISEKSENLNLDLFSCLLPVLSSLLHSKNERHVKVSVDTLLKLVGVFTPIIHSTIQSPPVVGVDLHADRRREWCNKCSAELQKIQKFLPEIMIFLTGFFSMFPCIIALSSFGRRQGGTLSRCAQELNLILKQPY